MKKILIYGAGAVGLGIASCLLKVGEEVHIIARKDTVLSLKENGLLRTGIFGEYYAEPEIVNCYSSLNELPSEKYDYILVSTKSYDSLKAAEDIFSCHSLSNTYNIVLFQNGWGNTEIFSSFFADKNIYNARVITGFYRPQKNQTDITVHADAIHIGSLYKSELSDIEYLCQSINDGGIPCEVTDNIEKDLWAKMLYNCALNPLGAVFKVPYGTLGEWEYTRVIMNGIVEEIFHIMLKYGYTTHWNSSKDYLKVFYDKLIPFTAKHESSMLQDIRSKKKTEIDALNGAIVKLGEKQDIAVPYNFTIYNMLKFIEAKNIN